MCVALSLSVAADEFLFGRIVSPDADVSVRLATTVPSGLDPFSLFWVSAADRERFEWRVRDHDDVEALAVVCDGHESVQYALQWNHDADPLVSALIDSRAVVLEGRLDGREWTFGLRFADRESLQDFRDRCHAADLAFDVEQIESGARRGCRRPTTHLTAEQREALLLALDTGYFAIPKQTTLADLGEELDITQQAVSQRLNRAIRNCLHEYFHLASR